MKHSDSLGAALLDKLMYAQAKMRRGQDEKTQVYRSLTMLCLDQGIEEVFFKKTQLLLLGQLCHFKKGVPAVLSISRV